MTLTRETRSRSKRPVDPPYRRGLALAVAPVEADDPLIERIVDEDLPTFAPTSTGAPVRPHRGSRATPAPGRPARRRFSRMMRVVAIVTALSATTMGVVVLSTNAYFTSGTLIGATISPGTIKFDIRSAANVTNPTFVVSNIVPLSTGDAGIKTKGTIVDFKLQSSSLAGRGVLTLAPIAGTTTAGLLPWIRVQISTDNGVNYSTATALDTASHATGEFVLPANTTQSMKMRFYLDPATPNHLQGGSLAYTLSTKSIQNVAPAGTSF